ncbi:MAG: hypothetical protein RBG13Loki_0465, partial [Promethearchaeota archaeon CR_4]
TTYNLVVEVSGLTSLNPVVVAFTVSREFAYGDPSTNETTPETPPEPRGLTIGSEGTMIIGGVCAASLGFVSFMVVGGKRKRKIHAKAGQVKRPGAAGDE